VPKTSATPPPSPDQSIKSSPMLIHTSQACREHMCQEGVAPVEIHELYGKSFRLLKEGMGVPGGCGCHSARRSRTRAQRCSAPWGARPRGYLLSPCRLHPAPHSRGLSSYCTELMITRHLATAKSLSRTVAPVFAHCLCVLSGKYALSAAQYSTSFRRAARRSFRGLLCDNRAGSGGGRRRT